MPPASYQIRQCQRDGCGLRYPVVEGQPFSERCPRCRGRTILVLEHPLEREAWQAPPTSSVPAIPIPYPPIPTSPIRSSSLVHALLDNIRSAWNVGSMFRTADGAGIASLHLCGITPTPDIPAVGKTALGAENRVTWDYVPDGVTAAAKLSSQGYCLWALEQHPRARSIYEPELPPPGAALVLVVGNEVCGVDPGILELCQQIVHIPMQGGKRSLNVAVAFGIAAFAIRYAG